STRSAALGGAGAALVGDAGAVFANPAAIATGKRLSIEGSYESRPAGTAVSSAALVLRVGRLNWGFGTQALDYGGTFQNYEVLALSSVVYRRGLVALGVSGKYDRQLIGSAVADAWAGDVGAAIAVFDIMALGVSVQNLGGDFGTGVGALPRRTRAGFTLNYTDPQGAFRLLTTLEGQWLRNQGEGTARLITGVEGGVVTGRIGLVGRTAYATRPGVAGGSRLTAGGGVVLGSLQVDYAFQAYAVPGGGTHRVGVRWAP
ncbi:MAG: hypothetical protein ACREMC_10930, partial [Gemmatimonadales bacterium]